MKRGVLAGVTWVLGTLVSACSSNAVDREQLASDGGLPRTLPDASPAEKPDASPAEELERPPLGWSLRDDVPYARTGHVTILDEENDRLIVFGGVANDTWALPLSGPNEHVWAELKIAGQPPAWHGDPLGYSSNAAVYDRRGQRLLLLGSAPSYSDAPQTSVVWQLSLREEPTWSAILATGEAPPDSMAIALDVDDDRLLAVGNGVWSLSLEGTPTWTHVTDLPAGVEKYGGGVVAFDRSPRRLVISELSDEGFPTPVSAWSLSLDTNTWVRHGTTYHEIGVATVFDEQSDRLLTFGGNGPKIEILSLSADGSTRSTKAEQNEGELSATGVIDARRNRILYFGGATNAVSSIDLDTLEWAQVVAPTRWSGTSDPNFTWDPVRAQLVAFGDHGTAAIYDVAGQAIVAFGNYNAIGELDPQRRASAPGSYWEPIHAGTGPGARSGHVGVYDEPRHRMIIHGGLRHIFDVGDEVLGDVWALNLDGAPAWVALEPEGSSPEAQSGHVGVYDPDGQRLIVYGVSSESHPDSGRDYTALWSLSLDDAPRWTELSPSGTGPGELGFSGRASAVYDPGHRRMIVLSFSASFDARVFALELDGAPTWHEFCQPGIIPSSTSNGTVGAGDAVLVPDGLFLSAGGASFRFNLETPYCDG